MSENECYDFNELLKKASTGDIVSEYLKSLSNLPRPAVGFAIKADLKMSTNGRGIGVFAAQFLPAGTRVDTDREQTCFTKEQAYAFMEAVPNDEQRRWWLNHFYCSDGLMKVDAVSLDTTMINHAQDPTVVTRENDCDYTTRDVHIGEELTEDYSTYDVVSYYDELCQKYGVHHFDNAWK